MFTRGPWLGQVPLILGPSSWGAGMIPLAPLAPMVSPAAEAACPPGSVMDPETGECVYVELPTVPTVPYGSFF